jgi:very-short-patch-repair endonuclease
MPQRKKPEQLQRAHDLRKESTEAEMILWTYLRSHRFNNIHFRRQHAIGKYIVDFCAPREKLIIEVDGSQHLDHEKQDAERTDYLHSRGYHVIRFWNNEVMNNLDGVIKLIELELRAGKYK